MNNSKEDEEGGLSAKSVNAITSIFLGVSFAILLYTLDHHVAGVIGKKTSLLQERIDRVIANNR